MLIVGCSVLLEDDSFVLGVLGPSVLPVVDF